MIKKFSAQAAVAGAIALALIGGTAPAAMADALPNGSSAPFFIFNDTPELIADGATIQWDDFVLGNPTADNPGAYITGSPDATGSRVFLSVRGQERDIQNWTGISDSALSPGTHDIMYPTLMLDFLVGANMGSVKTNGGQYSLGVAFTKGLGVQIADAGVVFAHITVNPGGTWSYVASQGDGPVEEPVGQADIDLEATTLAATDGALTLSVPANAKATFGTATLVGGRSTSTATLPEFTVSDARVVSAPGWTLTQSTANFVSGGTTTIDAKHLGVAPKIVAAGTTSTSATAAAAQVADSANNTGAAFAQATAGAGSLGDTKLSADLKLVAPADAPAGTYTSKMTLTLVSK